MDNIKIKIHTQVIKASIYRANIGNYADVYEDKYEVVPNVIEQKLNTNNKLMKNDVTVKAIPYYEVSNDSGITVIIGDD